MILRIEKHSTSEWCYLCTVGSSKGFAYCQLGMWDSATLTETTLAVPSTLPQCIHNTYYQGILWVHVGVLLPVYGHEEGPTEAPWLSYWLLENIHIENCYCNYYSY